MSTEDVTQLPIVTSMGALLRTRANRREVRAPKREDYPDTVGWIPDAELGVNLPAVIGIAGRFAGVGTVRGHRFAQWQIWIHPATNAKLAQRVAREDIRDLVELLHRDLTATRPRMGATYTAYFTVPRGGGDNILRVSFAGATRSAPDPWLENDRSAERVRNILQTGLDPVFQSLWDSWTRDPKVSVQLSAQGIPIAAGHKTQFVAGNPTDHVRAMLPENMRRTVFVGMLDEIDDLPVAARSEEPPVDWGHAATMIALIAVLATVYFLVWSVVTG